MREPSSERVLAAALAAALAGSCAPPEPRDPFGPTSSIALPGSPARALAATPGWPTPLAVGSELDGVVYTVEAPGRAVSFEQTLDAAGSPRALAYSAPALFGANFSEGTLGIFGSPADATALALDGLPTSIAATRWAGVDALAAASLVGAAGRVSAVSVESLEELFAHDLADPVVAVAALAESRLVSLSPSGALSLHDPAGATPFGASCEAPLTLATALRGTEPVALVGCDGALLVVDATGGSSLEGVAGRIYSIVGADLDGDGDLDVAAVDVETHELLLWLGSAEAWTLLRRPTRRGPVALAWADLDGDGARDAAVLSYEENALEVHWGLGSAGP